MVEALHKGLAPDCAGTEPGTKASQQEKWQNRNESKKN